MPPRASSPTPSASTTAASRPTGRARGEGGPFVEDGKLAGPAGALTLNTAGGNLAEAYVHGLNLVVEGVRQMRGESTCQVRDAELCLVAGGPGVAPTSALVLRRG